MHLSALLGETLRQPPSEARLVSHQLLARAAYIRGLDIGQFAYLPLGQRALYRLRTLVRSELSALGAQEMQLPPSPEVDRPRTLVRIVGREVDSYRQLPVLLYRFTSQSNLEPRGSSGLFGAGRRFDSQIDILDFILCHGHVCVAKRRPGELNLVR